MRGVRLAKRLDGLARVTLVDRKEVFFHRIASLRAGVRPEWTHSPLHPVRPAARQRPGGRGQGASASTPPSGRSSSPPASGCPYDVVVIATGADYPEPARFTGTTAEEAAKSFAEHQQQHRHRGTRPGRRRRPSAASNSAPRSASPGRTPGSHSPTPGRHCSTPRAAGGPGARPWPGWSPTTSRYGSTPSCRPGNDFGTYRDARGERHRGRPLLLGDRHHPQHALAAPGRTRRLAERERTCEGRPDAPRRGPSWTCSRSAT